MKSANIEASSHMHSACRHLHISFTPASLQFHTGIEEHSCPSLSWELEENAQGFQQVQNENSERWLARCTQVTALGE